MPHTQKAQPRPAVTAPAAQPRLDPQTREALQAALTALEAASAALAAVAAAQQAQPAPKPATPTKAVVAAAVPGKASPSHPGHKRTRAERSAANKAAHASSRAAYARTHMQDADGPATASQLWYLHLLLNTDTRTPKYQRLTKAQAAKMITELKARKASGTRSA